MPPRIVCACQPTKVYNKTCSTERCTAHRVDLCVWLCLLFPPLPHPCICMDLVVGYC